LAHTTALQFSGFEREAITQRPLMVVPNLPRYFREGDRITVTAKINALEQRVEGPARLELFDPFTNATLDKAFSLQVPEQVFVAAPGASASVAWELQVPEGVQAVGVRITARGGGGPVGGASYGDGEEHVLPVLTDRVLVTESLPLPVNSPGTHAFTLQKLLDSGKNTTLRHERLQLEFTPNPAWTAVLALPYLMEFPHACAEQVFSRYYANRLAGHVLGEKPRIREVFEQWREAGPDAFLSALEKDPELKDIALAETPWLLDARDERERKERIALLFDLDRMAGEEAKALQQLRDMQGSGGAWSWFGGMRPSPYITRHIVAGFGHLEALGAADLRPDGEVQRMLQRAVGWLDDHLRERHRELKDRLSAKELSAYRPGPDELHHLYARSFFRRWPTAGANAAAYRFYQDRAAAEWLSYGLQEQLMLALTLHRSGDGSTARDILNSLRQRATIDDELGMTWKSFRAGMDWWAFPA
ncbi:MAG TPA: alpha-2-macroglobulin, partial [Flavobacteriales bacterium]|nr:alpha-2-macroglobulin [Flavobacteriales bacterium]